MNMNSHFESSLLCYYFYLYTYVSYRYEWQNVNLTFVLELYFPFSIPKFSQVYLNLYTESRTTTDKLAKTCVSVVILSRIQMLICLNPGSKLTLFVVKIF